MVTYFVTGNKNKLLEMQELLPDLIQLDVDLPEIQSDDPEEVVREKLKSAFQHTQNPCVVEDISFHLDCLNGFPGPLIKWFLKRVGTGGIQAVAERSGDLRAEARCTIGYATSYSKMYFFSGIVPGRIVASRGESRFGFDPIFQPDGHEKTYAEMTLEEKNRYSHRGIATRKLVEFLSQNA